MKHIRNVKAEKYQNDVFNNARESFKAKKKECQKDIKINQTQVLLRIASRYLQKMVQHRMRKKSPANNVCTRLVVLVVVCKIRPKERRQRRRNDDYVAATESALEHIIVM